MKYQKALGDPATKSGGIGGIHTIIMKNISKIPQFLFKNKKNI